MYSIILDMVTTTINSFDELAEDTPAHQVVLATAAAYFLYNQFNNPWIFRAFRGRHNETYQQKVLDAGYELAKSLPQVRLHVQKAMDKNLHSTREKLETQRALMNLKESIPKEGRPVVEILAEFSIDPDDCLFNFSSAGADGQTYMVQALDGKDSGALYAVHPKELTELLKEVYAKTALSNPMHDKWPRINAMQAEIIQWCQNLFHGSKEGYGVLTHGGTTSIIEAMAAYVIDARAKGIKYPEIVVPETAHAAFKKAAELTGATLITVPVDPMTGAVSAQTMRGYISSNTAVIIGSAPSFMNGIHDPIGDLGRLARQKKVPFHVDACLGGFLTAFMDTSDDPMDFRVPGVTSISADLHKYGCCPKGTSVCLFSKQSPALSVYAALNWPGGLYATPGILDGSTSGARVAEIFATLSYYGFDKYKAISASIIALRQGIERDVFDLLNEEDIYIYGAPKWSVLGFRSHTLNAHMVADELDKLGWKLNLLQNPDGFHLCLTHVHTLVENFKDKFIKDLNFAIEEVKAYPADQKPSGNVKVYGAIGTMPTAIQKEVCVQYQKARLAFNANLLFQPTREDTGDDIKALSSSITSK